MDKTWQSLMESLREMEWEPPQKGEYEYFQPPGAGAYPGYRTLSEETKQKISNSLKGNIPWNKGKKGVQIPTEETRKKMSDAHKKYHTEEEKKQADREKYKRYREKNKEEIKRRREAKRNLK
jgi:hypothetical protein